VTRFALAVTLLVLAVSACEDKPSPEPVPSAVPDLEPRLASRYATPWGELGWDSRLHDTITFTNPGQTVFLRCTVQNSPVVTCAWSRQSKFDLRSWDRGKARFQVVRGTTLKGTWGNDDSEDDGGPCELKPLPR
jgi:hypothetical protein